MPVLVQPVLLVLAGVHLVAGAFSGDRWSGLVTWVVLKLTVRVTGMRVTSDEETEGLDTVEHNEKGYNL